MTPPFTKHRDSSEALACHHRGLELLESQQAPLAIAELERAVALEPGNAEFLKSLGNAQKAAGKLDDAIASYRRSLDITPDYLPSLYNLAVTLRETGNAGEAEQRFRRLRELEPNDVDTLFHLGGLLAVHSQFVESAAVYRDALRLMPDNPYLWLALGRVTQGMPGQLEESVRCLQKAIELYPDLADAHYRLGLARHLGRLRAADLFLDTFPYNAHTTTSDALWVGLPVLTCTGDTFASRVAGSLLSAAGMTELITSSLEAYEACALRLARNTPALIALREKLSRGRDTAPLFDTPLFARHLEAAYLRMWEIYVRGEPPRAIDV
jgi:predicted O-linked N-acetylglucosamine transferase (SPINDLY family)